MHIIPENFEIDFTDDQISPTAGSFFIARMAQHLGLPEAIDKHLHLKKRRRGASDAEMMLSLIYSLAQGDGAILDVERLRADSPRRSLLGLKTVPDHRRLGEYLHRFDDTACRSLTDLAQAVVRQVAPAVIDHEIETRGYVPVFVDGSGIEVSGRYFEGANKLYNDSEGYWLHGVFVGGLWVEQRLHPGGVDVAKGWREQLEAVAGLIGEGKPVWARMDNAYYRKSVVEYCDAQGWDYSISVTNATYKRPLRDVVSAFWEEDWTPINDDGTEHAALIHYRPENWEEEHTYVVVRSLYDGNQRLIWPRYTFILVSDDELSLRQLVRRHRGKQGQENAFKGPLIDLDLHHPPCSKFAANRAFYTAGQLAQVLLVAVQYHLLPTEARRHAIRTVIRDLVRTAGKIVRHARRWKLLFAKSGLRLWWLAHAADRLEALAHAPP